MSSFTGLKEASLTAPYFNLDTLRFYDGDTKQWKKATIHTCMKKSWGRKVPSNLLMSPTSLHGVKDIMQNAF